MEKINALIDKLQELKAARANLQTISYYSQLLQAEILHQRNILQRERDLNSGSHGHVAVILPVQAAVVEAVVVEEEKTVATTPAPPTNHEPYLPPVAAQMIQPTPPPPAEAPAPEPVVPERRDNGYHPDRVPIKTKQQEEPKRPTLFDMPEKPHYNGHTEPAATNIRKDINELVNGNSLNDQLRQSNIEVGQRLGEMGIQDLKNAIGINDRFRFIEELFRGEKNMYERSIKTINECTSLQEANNWIERELKVKEGWLEDNPLVQQFCAIVKKRFT